MTHHTDFRLAPSRAARLSASRLSALPLGALPLGALLVAAVVAGLPSAALASTLPTTERSMTEQPAPTTWTLQPASDEGPDGRVSLRHTADPGDIVADSVALTNYGPSPVEFAVYASEGTITDGGAFDLTSAGSDNPGAGAWVTMLAIAGATPRPEGGILMTVAGDSTVILPIEVAVPADATPGDHPLGIVSELTSTDGSGVNLISRVGVRLHLRVSGDVVAELTPRSIETRFSASWNPFAPGTMTVEYPLTNTGNVRLGAVTGASSSGPAGMLRASSSGTVQEILPSESATVTTELPVWPTFFVSGEVTSTPTVVGEDVVEAPLSPRSATFGTWVMPWSQLVLLAIVIGAGLVMRGLRRRSKHRIQARIDAAVDAATGADHRDADAGRAPLTPPHPEPMTSD